MIKEWGCMNCDDAINSESHVVFCNEACLKEYISDLESLEKFLVKNLEREYD
jgi:hypothetical protein